MGCEPWLQCTSTAPVHKYHKLGLPRPDKVWAKLLTGRLSRAHELPLRRTEGSSGDSRALVFACRLELSVAVASPSQVSPHTVECYALGHLFGALGLRAYGVRALSEELFG